MLKTIFSGHDLAAGFSEADSALVAKALLWVEPCREKASLRPKGYEVAAELLKLNVDSATIIAAILSEPLLREELDMATLEKQFGTEIVDLVKDVNWLNTLNIYQTEMSQQPQQTETLRRMLLSMTHDVRAVLIKLAYRIQRLKNLPQEGYDMRLFVARETLDIYAPIANRLGIGQLKWEMEDLAFRYLEPQSYLSIAKSLADNRKQRELCISGFTTLLEDILLNEQIHAQINGRPKHIYSIWKKMQRKQLPIEELYDLLAVRVTVEKVSSCYAVLGIVHGKWQYIPKEFDDYIANPKENGYQSLHTVVLDAQGNRIEIQIRTQQMHEFAELGVAAHWRYKEGGKQDNAADKSIASLRQLLDDKGTNAALMEDFHNELFSDRVFTLTPKGQLVDLVKGATPLDFAYAIHTELGHRCRGAKINGRIVPLTYSLQSGEYVTILTTKEGSPNRNWIDPNLGYLKTSRAISQVKSWFKQEQQEHNQAAGALILNREAQKLGLATPNIQALCHYFNIADPEKLLIAIGSGDISTRQIAGFLHIPSAVPKAFKKNKVKPPLTPSTISVQGVDNVLSSMAKCCNPVPGDIITGFISQSKGITIHRSDCNNIKKLKPEQQTRLIDVNWGRHEPRLAVPIIVQAYDRQGLLNDVTRVLDENKINIIDACFESHDNLSATLELIIQIDDATQLSHVLGKISQLANVYEARRKS